MRLTKIMTALLIIAALASSAHADQSCGAWNYTESVDAMNDTTVRYASTTAEGKGAMLAVRCMPGGDYQLAMVFARMPMSTGLRSDPADSRYIVAQVRIDDGQVHELMLWKVTSKLYMASATNGRPKSARTVVTQAVSEIKHGESVLVRVHERGNKTSDHRFAGGAPAGADCIEAVAPCID